MGGTRSDNLTDVLERQPATGRDFGFSAVELMLVTALLAVVNF